MITELKEFYIPGSEFFDYAQTVELNVGASPTTNSKIDFGQNNIYTNLQYGIVTGMIVYNVSMLTKSITNKAVINTTAFAQSYITLTEDGTNNRLMQIPLSLFTPTSANPYPRFLKPFNPLDFSNSYIQVPDPSTLVANESYVFTFLFKKKSGPARMN
jgi:hypothetical protein